MQHWTGTIAYLDTPTVDGRTLQAPQELRLAGPPLPLLSTGETTEHLGSVDSVTIRGRELRADGTVRDGVLKPGEKLPVGVDLDDVTFASPGTLVRWRLRAVTAYLGHGEPAWPGAHIRLVEAGPADEIIA